MEVLPVWSSALAPRPPQEDWKSGIAPAGAQISNTPSVFRAKFWGVRGSIPAPLTARQVRAKEAKLLRYLRERGLQMPWPATETETQEWLQANVPFALHGTYGGNTTCVEVQAGDKLFILDLGTGVRELGNAHFANAFKNGGLRAIILQSHLHWDHIQGFPFLGEIYLPLIKYPNNHLRFFGGQDWQSSLEAVLRGQMNPPVFPVSMTELERTSLKMTFETVWQDKVLTFDDGAGQTITVKIGKLNHPQETYGYRIEYAGKVLSVCFDHEPFGMMSLHRPLMTLADGADVLITECQYTLNEYVGHGGRVQKLGWGHSVPEYIAKVAEEAKVGRVYTLHHDPASDEERVELIASVVQGLSKVQTAAAWEGLEIDMLAA